MPFNGGCFFVITNAKFACDRTESLAHRKKDGAGAEAAESVRILWKPNWVSMGVHTRREGAWACTGRAQHQACVRRRVGGPDE